MYEFQAKIRYSETDSNGNLSLLGLLNYFQDSSIFHSDSLGAGVEALKDQGMFWALSAWQIVVKRYPKVCETVTVGTAPYEFKGFMGNRNFWMKDESGEMIAWANSIWSLVDIQSGMPKNVRLKFRRYINSLPNWTWNMRREEYSLKESLSGKKK